MTWMNVIEILVRVAIIIASGVASYFITKKRKALELQENSELVDMAYGIANDAVIYVNQTFVDSLKHSGNWTAASGKEAKEMCIKRFYDTVSTMQKDAVKNLYGNLDTWLELTIESLVNQNKVGE